MRKNKKEGVFTAKASKLMTEGEVFTEELSQRIIDTPITLNFENALDWFIWSLDQFKDKINQEPENHPLKRFLEYLIQMRDFFSTRVTSLDLSPSPGDPLPYKWEVAYKIVGDETIEQVSQKIEKYLYSPIFAAIVDKINPLYFDILRQKSELTKREEELSKREAELKKEHKVGKYKRSGHLTDQMLKFNYPKDTKGQLSIFDSLEDATKKAIETVGGIEITEIVEGIKLSPSETKVIDCLCKLLHENSQTFEPKKEDYYSGNKGFELVEFGGDKNTPAPKLAFTLYELTKEYKAGEYVGGKDIDNVKQILTELDNKKFLLSYVETTKTKGGGRVERKIEDFRKLIHIVKISQTEFNKEDIELSKIEDTIVVLNPIFRRQIDSKFILYPNDINKRTIIAYGSHNLSDIALRLRDYLMRELSSKHYKPEINLDKLFYLLAEKWMKESRKTKVKQYTEKALETVKTLGLIESYEIKTGATGEPKVIFTLNKDWE